MCRPKPYVPAGLTLLLRNKAQVVLFKEELSGQISDGVWENSRPFNHWFWAGNVKVDVVTAPFKVGFSYPNMTWDYKPPRRYNFCNEILIDACGDRMIEAVEKAVGCAYDLKLLKRDLRDISKIVNGRG